MSDVPTPIDTIDMQAVLAKIRRDQAETDKFAAEQRKLTNEANKLVTDRWLAPFLALGGLLVGGLGVVVAAAGLLLHTR